MSTEIKKPFNMAAIINELANLTPANLLAMHSCASDLLNGSGDGTGLDLKTTKLAIAKGFMNTDVMSQGEAFAIIEASKMLDKQEFRGIRMMMGLK